MTRPFIIVVTGRPGSGKTTLAHALASRIRCPALCRDELKEGVVHSLGGSHASLGEGVDRRVYATFFDIIEFLVKRRL